MKTHKRDTGNWYDYGRCGKKDVQTSDNWRKVTCQNCIKMKRPSYVKVFIPVSDR